MKWLNYTSMDDFNKLNKHLEPKQKGDNFELLCQYIFKIQPEYRNKTKNIWLYNEIPSNIKQKFKLPEQDKGIDLILETIDDDYFAIQCKYRSNQNKKVTWTELSTFVGQLFTGKFKKAIYMTNTYEIDEELAKCDNIFVLNGYYFDELQPLFFNNIINLQNNNQIEYIKKEPKYYQKICIKKAIKHFSEIDERGYLNMCCGSGKTYTTICIDQKLNTYITIVLVPSLYLLTQLYNEWAENCNCNYILVGSDADIDKDIYEEKNIFLSTDEDEIQERFKKYSKGKLVIISTYQSSHRLSFIESCDLIIFDEAHKTVGNEKFSYLINNIECNRRLFVTATPKIYNTVNDEDDDVVCMGNEKLYGEEIYKYQINDAIDDGNLCPYEIHCMVIDDKDMKAYKKKNKIVKVDDIEYGSHYIMTLMMIQNMIDKGDINHLLTYHATIANSKKFAKLLERIDDVNIAQLDGTDSSKIKSRRIKEFIDSDKAIITSARVLNEGVNIPIVDSVCFVESRNSAIDIIQCIGRALRLCKGKKIARILIPVLKSELDEKSNFASMIKIIKNIGDYDSRMTEYYQKIINGEKVVRELVKISQYKSDGIIESEKIDYDVIRGKIDTCIIAGVYNWYQIYNDVTQFIEKYKKRPNSNSKNITEKQLGSWISNQIKNYKQNKEAMKDNYKRLKWEELNEKYKEYMMNFDEIWYQIYNDIIQFIEKYEKRPNKESKNITEKKMGIWIGNQLRNYKQNKESMKDDDKRIKWEEFIEKYKDYMMNRDEIWYQTYDDVIQFIEKYKKRPNKRSNNITEKKLGTWIGTQLNSYKQNKESMKDDDKRIKWEEFIEKYKEYMMDFDEIWYQTYDDVIQFIEKYKKRPSTISKNITEKKLGTWIGTQLNSYKQNKKSMKDDDKRIKWEELNEKYKEYMMDFDEIWYQTYDDVIQFIEKYKKKPSTISKNITEKKMGMWISQQLTNYKQNKNSMKDDDKRIKWEELNEKYKEYMMDFDEIWYQTYDDVIQFIEKYKKRPNKRSNNITEKKLGTWIGTQLNSYKQNKYSMKDDDKRIKWEEFIEKYKEYMMDNNEQWYQIYDDVIQFIKKYKKRPNKRSSDITEKKLGSWISNQIQNYKQNKLLIKDDDKRLKWEELNEKYSILF
jgi:superfamily II DNA or RNA helicase